MVLAIELISVKDFLPTLGDHILWAGYVHLMAKHLSLRLSSMYWMITTFSQIMNTQVNLSRCVHICHNKWTETIRMIQVHLRFLNILWRSSIVCGRDQFRMLADLFSVNSLDFALCTGGRGVEKGAMLAAHIKSQTSPKASDDT